MKLFVTIYHDASLLQHFLSHYSGAGITEFFVAVAPEFVPAARHCTPDARVTICEGLDVADSVAGTAAVSEMRRRYQEPDEWVVIVDLDEFVEFGEAIDSLLAAADAAGATVIRGIMHDRFSADGRLTPFSAGADLSAVYPVKSRFIRNVMRGCDHKGVLVRGRIMPAPGAAHHWFENERVHAKVLEISHYKWTPGSIDRLRHAHAIVENAGISWAPEYQRALDHYDAYGRFAWETFGGQLAEHFRMEPPDACVECNAPLSEGEFRYSTGRFGRGLCRAHQLRRSEAEGRRVRA
jgi:hypothetical protein